jgi:tungstate transport system substrate-binding protein
MRRSNLALSLFLLTFFMLTLFVWGCSSGTQQKPSEKPTEAEKTAEQTQTPTEPAGTIKLATTTSVDNSGLLEYILPDLEAKHNMKVDVIAVGTGKALEHGCAGDVDVVIVHSEKAEMKFIEDGCGMERFYICQNEFVIAGPKDDPAKVKESRSAIEAMKKIADVKAKFISRGDDSGTHKAEKSLWEKAGIKPSGDWYIEAGQGMGPVLTMATEQAAYTLTDTGTFYSMIDKLNLDACFTGDPVLENVYSVIPLNPDKYPDLKHDAVKTFVQWITSPETAELITGYEANGYQLFRVEKPAGYMNKPAMVNSTDVSGTPDASGQPPEGK